MSAFTLDMSHCRQCHSEVLCTLSEAGSKYFRVYNSLIIPDRVTITPQSGTVFILKFISFNIQFYMSSPIQYGGDSSGGFDNFFLEPVPDRLICTICTKVLKDPHLMACCGKKFCISCLQMWFSHQQEEKCPHCRATQEDDNYAVLHILDKGLRSEIESRLVHCPNVDDGCEWKGELRDFSLHLSKCELCWVHCPRGCRRKNGVKTIVCRRYMEEHLKYFCYLIQKSCKYCDYVGTAENFRAHKECCGKHKLAASTDSMSDKERTHEIKKMTV